MLDREIDHFVSAASLATQGFFIDSIRRLRQLVEEFPTSDLVDDALYNVGLCYFELHQFDRALASLEELVESYPDSTITALDKSNEYGKTAAKACYLMVNCHLAKGQIKAARKLLVALEQYNDSYILDGDQKISFTEMGRRSVDTYLRINQEKV